MQNKSTWAGLFRIVYIKEKNCCACGLNVELKNMNTKYAYVGNTFWVYKNDSALRDLKNNK